MGNYVAYTILGMHVRREMLFESKSENGCEHEFDRSFSFCPHCGEPRTHTTVSSIFDEDMGPESGMIGGYNIIEPHDFSEDAFIAHSYRRVRDFDDINWVIWETDGEGRKLSMSQIEQEMRSELPERVVKSGRFGLFTVIAYR